MPNPIKTFPHVISYVKTHKFLDLKAHKTYFLDTPEIIPLIGADYYLLVYLDDYFEYAGSFYKLDGAKTKGQAYLGMYSGFQVYSYPEHKLVFQRFQKYAFQAITPYKFLPKKPL